MGRHRSAGQSGAVRMMRGNGRHRSPPTSRSRITTVRADRVIRSARPSTGRRMSMAQTILRVFTTRQEARTYRHEHGTGGWIFVDDATGAATLFPPDVTPSGIFHHPL